MNRYLIVDNVPAYGNMDAVTDMFAQYGTIEEIYTLDEENDNQLVDIYWIKYKDIADARKAKLKLHSTSFLGNLIYVRYAPEYETLDDTRMKLNDRMHTVMIKLLKEAKFSKEDIDQLVQLEDQMGYPVASQENQTQAP